MRLSVIRVAAGAGLLSNASLAVLDGGPGQAGCSPAHDRPAPTPAWLPAVRSTPEKALTLTAEEEMKTLSSPARKVAGSWEEDLPSRWTPQVL